MKAASILYPGKEKVGRAVRITVAAGLLLPIALLLSGPAEALDRDSGCPSCCCGRTAPDAPAAGCHLDKGSLPREEPGGRDCGDCLCSPCPPLYCLVPAGICEVSERFVCLRPDPATRLSAPVPELDPPPPRQFGI